MSKLKLWLLTQEVENGYDTYDSCVVVAENEAFAKLITPDRWDRKSIHSWAHEPSQVEAKLLGTADNSLEAGEIVLASFNPG